jgi:hypothetical protein
MLGKKFGSIKVKPRFDFLDEHRVRFAFEMYGSPKAAAPISEFCEDILDAVIFIITTYRNVHEGTKNEHMDEVLGNFCEAIRRS